MQESALPTISVIIPVREERSAEPVLESLRTVNYPVDRFEIIVTRGKQPSRQRNEAVAIARGELLYFLDNDSLVAPNLFRRAVATLETNRADVVGGPSATPLDDTLLQRCFGYAYGSPFGTLGSRRRYRSIGAVKEATETDLIMCNLCIRRSAFVNAGCLDERLYPNEENEFLNRLNQRGNRLIYDPQAIVYRSQRASWSAFARQVFHYGRGRIDHFFASPAFFNPVFLVPLLLLIYLGLLLFFFSALNSVPLFLYGALTVIASADAARRERRIKALFLMLAVFPVMHLSYGLGTVRGVVENALGSPRLMVAPVHTTKVKPIGSPHWLDEKIGVPPEVSSVVEPKQGA